MKMQQPKSIFQLMGHIFDWNIINIIVLVVMVGSKQQWTGQRMCIYWQPSCAWRIRQEQDNIDDDGKQTVKEDGINKQCPINWHQ